MCDHFDYNRLKASSIVQAKGTDDPYIADYGDDFRSDHMDPGEPCHEGIRPTASEECEEYITIPRNDDD